MVWLDFDMCFSRCVVFYYCIIINKRIRGTNAHAKSRTQTPKGDINQFIISLCMHPSYTDFYGVLFHKGDCTSLSLFYWAYWAQTHDIKPNSGGSMSPMGLLVELTANIHLFLFKKTVKNKKNKTKQ